MGRNYFVPCKPGDKVYVIYSGLGSGYKIITDAVLWVTINKTGIFFETNYITGGRFGVDIFQTEDDARRYASEHNIELDD